MQKLQPEMIPYSCMKADGGDTVLWQQKQLRCVVQISLEFQIFGVKVSHRHVMQHQTHDANLQQDDAGMCACQCGMHLWMLICWHAADGFKNSFFACCISGHNVIMQLRCISRSLWKNFGLPKFYVQFVHSWY